MQLSPDRALTDPGEDRLGLAPFAKALANGLTQMAPRDGLVVAIHAPWGSGKTTLLNFVTHYLQAVPGDVRPVVINFNPWWFSGQHDLVARFFSQLLAQFGTWKEKRDELLMHLEEFGALVSKVDVPFAGVAGGILQKIPPKKDVVELKRRIAELLSEQSQRIVIVIDDIDRLTQEELRQIFGVVKAVADFPNVTYLLAFDKGIVAEALSGHFGPSGEAYLEKIVQVSFELPVPDRSSLRKLLFEKLELLLISTPEGLFDKERWANVYLEGVDHFIQTPRDVLRLTNTLMVTYSSQTIAAEVNAVDFIAVEALRVFRPSVYDVVRRTSALFTGAAEMQAATEKQFHESWLQGLPDEQRPPIRDLMTHLFPRLGVHWGGASYGSSWLSRWHRERRVCSPEVFPLYFYLAPPEGHVSHSDMTAAIALAEDPETFGSLLLSLAGETRADGSSRVSAFLEYLAHYAEDTLDPATVLAILKALFTVGDRLLVADPRRNMFDFGNEVRIGRVVWRLLRQLNQPDRFNILLAAVTEGIALGVLEHEVSVLGQERERVDAEGRTPGAGEALVTADQLKQLEAVVLQKIRNAASAKSLLSLGECLPSVLYRWSRWSGSDAEPRDWVQTVITNDADLATFIESFAQTTFSSGGGSPIERRHLRVSPKILGPFLDVASLVERLETLAQNTSVPEKQRLAIRQLLKEHRMVEQGKDPDFPFDRD